MVLTPDMPILRCMSSRHHVVSYTLGRLSIEGFSFERVPQSNLEWIFSKLDSGFQSLVGFRIPSAGFRIPQAKKSWIPESGFPYMGRGLRKCYRTFGPFTDIKNKRGNSGNICLKVNDV